MNTKISLQTILIVLILSILVFVSTDAHVKGQIGGDDNPLSVNEADNQAVITAGSPVPGGPGFIMVSPFEFRPYRALINGLM